jgi:hypothetical protein
VYPPKPLPSTNKQLLVLAKAQTRAPGRNLEETNRHTTGIPYLDSIAARCIHVAQRVAMKVGSDSLKGDRKDALVDEERLFVSYGDVVRIDSCRSVIRSV